MAAVPPSSCGDLGGHSIIGGVGKAGIEVAARPPDRSSAPMSGGGVIFECGALNDGDHAGVRRFLGA